MVTSVVIYRFATSLLSSSLKNERIKKNLLCKNFFYFLTFQKIELSSCNYKKKIVFSQKKASLIFRETEIPEKFLIYQEMELSYISRNKNPKNFHIFEDVAFQAQKKQQQQKTKKKTL